MQAMLRCSEAWYGALETESVLVNLPSFWFLSINTLNALRFRLLFGSSHQREVQVPTFKLLHMRLQNHPSILRTPLDCRVCGGPRRAYRNLICRGSLPRKPSLIRLVLREFKDYLLRQECLLWRLYAILPVCRMCPLGLLQQLRLAAHATPHQPAGLHAYVSQHQAQ